MNFAKYFLTISTLCLSLSLQGILHAAAEYAAADSGTGAGVVEEDAGENQPVAPLTNLSGGVAEYKPAAAPRNPYLGYGVAVSAPATVADHSALAASAAGGGTATEEPLAHQALGNLQPDTLSSIASFLSEKDLASLAASHRKGRSIRNNQLQLISNNLIFPDKAEIVDPTLKLFFAKAIMQLNHQPNSENKYKVTPEVANRALENARLTHVGIEIISAITKILVASIDEYQQTFRYALDKAALLLQPYPGTQATIAEAREVLAREDNPLMQMAIRMLWHKHYPMAGNLDAINIKQIITIAAMDGGDLTIKIDFAMLTIPTKQNVQNIIDLISVLYNQAYTLIIKPFRFNHEIHITGNFPKLTEIYAQSATQLTSIDAKLIAPNLKWLGLTGSRIKTISGDFPHLADIFAPNTTQLTSINEKLLAPNLQNLFLNGSGIKAISGYFPKLTKIYVDSISQLTLIDGLNAPSLNLADWNNLREHVARNTALKEDE